MLRTVAFCITASLLCAWSVTAQTPAPGASDPRRDPPAVLAVEPLLVITPEHIAPADVHRLQTTVADFGQLARYRTENASLPPTQPGRVIFFGDSITDLWGRRGDETVFFPGKPYLNRGISGQTTTQMVVRFQQDVIALQPAAVVLLAGTNDLTGNTGAESLTDIENNFRSMVDMADAHHINVILASILPVEEYPWRKGVEPVPKIHALNDWLQQLCAARNYTYLDYYSALATPQGAMKPGTALDGVHPSAAGYGVMAPLAQAAIDRALALQ